MTLPSGTTKAVRGWLAVSEQDRPLVVAEHHRQAGAFGEPVVEQRRDGRPSDPLRAVWARRA